MSEGLVSKNSVVMGLLVLSFFILVPILVNYSDLRPGEICTSVCLIIFVLFILLAFFIPAVFKGINYFIIDLKKKRAIKRQKIAEFEDKLVDIEKDVEKLKRLGYDASFFGTELLKLKRKRDFNKLDDVRNQVSKKLDMYDSLIQAIDNLNLYLERNHQFFDKFYYENSSILLNAINQAAVDLDSESINRVFAEINNLKSSIDRINLLKKEGFQ